VDAALVHAVLARVDGAAFDRAAGMAFQGETAMLVSARARDALPFPASAGRARAAFPDVTVRSYLASNRGPWRPIRTDTSAAAGAIISGAAVRKLPRQQHKRVFS